MNLLEEVKPYQSHIDAYVKTKSMTDNKAKNALVLIWNRFINQPEISAKAYNGRVTKVPDVDMTCDSCKMKAIQKLVVWIDEIKKEVPRISFKGVLSENKVIEVKSNGLKFAETNVVYKDGEDCGIVSIPATTEEEIAFYKTHLNAAGVQYHHKAGIKKLSELYNELKK